MYGMVVNFNLTLLFSEEWGQFKGLSCLHPVEAIGEMKKKKRGGVRPI
jgi:hypothetical protein